MELLVPDAQDSSFEGLVIRIDPRVDGPDDYPLPTKPGGLAEVWDVDFLRRHIHQQPQVAGRYDPFDGGVLGQGVQAFKRQKRRPYFPAALGYSDRIRRGKVR